MVQATTISTEELRGLLVATHLHYDLGYKSLRQSALAEILAKILYMGGDHQARFSDLSQELAQILGASKINQDDINGAMGILAEKGIARKSGTYWVLNEKSIEEISANFIKTKERLSYILDKFFGTEIDREKLTSWFRLASSGLFATYGEVWFRSLYKKELIPTPDRNKTDKIFEEAAKKFGLESYCPSLKDGFYAFLADYQDPEIALQIWSFASTMLSARIITAGIGPDPISIKEFRGAKLFLDTNVLFVASLESSKFAKSISELTKALEKIDASLHIIHETKDEYENDSTSKAPGI